MDLFKIAGNSGIIGIVFVGGLIPLGMFSFLVMVIFFLLILFVMTNNLSISLLAEFIQYLIFSIVSLPISGIPYLIHFHRLEEAFNRFLNIPPPVPILPNEDDSMTTLKFTKVFPYGEYEIPPGVILLPPNKIDFTKEKLEILPDGFQAPTTRLRAPTTKLPESILKAPKEQFEIELEFRIATIDYLGHNDYM